MSKRAHYRAKAAQAKVLPREAPGLSWTQLALALLFGLTVATLTLSRSAKGAPASATSSPKAAAQPRTLSELEVRVWTADDMELQKLEREVVRLIQVDPESVFAHYLLVHVYCRTFARDPGDLYLIKQATDLAQQAIDLDQKAPYGYVAMAEILDLVGHADRAIALLAQAEKQGVRPNGRLAFARARLLSGDGNGGGTSPASGTKAALAELERASQSGDLDLRILAPYVVALLQSEFGGRELIARLENWQARFPAPLYQLTMAINHADLGEPTRAHTIYQDILRRDPRHREAKINDAILLYRKMGQAAKAVAILENALKNPAEPLPPRVKSTIQVHVAAAQLRRGREADAAKGFVEAISGDDDPSMLEFALRTYREAQAHKALVAMLRQLADVAPVRGNIHALIGETLSEGVNDHDGAIKAYANALVLEPGRADFYNGMGLAYYRKQALPEALKLFVTASELDPSDASARYNEACALSLLGRREDAIQILAEAITLDPRLMRSARHDTDFATIKDSLKFRELVQEAAISH